MAESEGAGPAHDGPGDVSTYEIEARSYELDAYGHLNQAVSVQWFEHGRLAYLAERGMTYTSIPADFGVHVMVLRQDVTYRAQILLGDRFLMTSRIARVGRTSFTWEQALVPVAGGDPAVTATVTMVCVGPDDRAAPMPDALRAALGV